MNQTNLSMQLVEVDLDKVSDRSRPAADPDHVVVTVDRDIGEVQLGEFWADGFISTPCMSMLKLALNEGQSCETIISIHTTRTSSFDPPTLKEHTGDMKISSWLNSRCA